ncbi:MAG: ribonuclease Z [Acidimicrobiales bacterium]
MSRELIVLGTSAQVPTRTRNHVGFVLRWDGDAFLVDPGEGTQRQMLLAGVTANEIGHVCITHLHGDHCLGLPGFLGRVSLDRVQHPIDLIHPASGRPFVQRLRRASVMDDRGHIVERPVVSDGPVVATDAWTLSARHLDHTIDTVGYRLEEAPGRTFLPDRLEAFGVSGPAVGELERSGRVEVDGRTVGLDDVSVPRPGQVVAFVLDTRVCDAAVELAAGADLVICESTFLQDETHLAHDYGHLTARQAATIAREAGARRLVLAHYSQRYAGEEAFLAEASEVHPDVVAARDLDVVAVPSRLTPGRG